MKNYMRNDELTTTEAAQYLGIKPRTLEFLRQKGRGPRCLDYGYRTKRYLPRHLDEWKKRRQRAALKKRVIVETKG